MISFPINENEILWKQSQTFKMGPIAKFFSVRVSETHTALNLNFWKNFLFGWGWGNGRRRGRGHGHGCGCGCGCGCGHGFERNCQTFLQHFFFFFFEKNSSFDNVTVSQRIKYSFSFWNSTLKELFLSFWNYCWTKFQTFLGFIFKLWTSCQKHSVNGQ